MDKQELASEILAAIRDCTKNGAHSVGLRLAELYIELVSDLVHEPAEAKREVGYDWWVIERDGVPELDDGTMYTYEYAARGGVGVVSRYGKHFNSDAGRIVDREGDPVIRICKVGMGAADG